MAQRVVVDASVALSWVLPGEESAATLGLRDRASDQSGLTLLVPGVFWTEVSNALWVAVRRARMMPETADMALEALLEFGFDSHEVSPRDTLCLALKVNVPAYDAVYLQAALDLETTLWTFDRPLARAAGTTGIATEPQI